MSLVFHIDDAPAVKSKTLNLWPIQCFVVELPLSIRYSFKNILFCGLWCGTKKPLLQLFQSYFVEQIEEINRTGVNVSINERMEVIRIPTIKVLGHIADLVAKAPSLNMKQFNGEFGCSICLHPGERIKKGRGSVRVYPIVKLYKCDGRTVSSGLQEPKDDLMKAFYQRGLLGSPFTEVSESDEIKIVHCKDVLRRCIFIPSSVEGISGYMCPVLKHYEHD